MEIIEVVLAGNSGLHQSGFARYARIMLECGHTHSVSYWLAGDRPDGRCVAADSTPIVGTRAHCPKCAGARTPASWYAEADPAAPNARGWACESRLISRLGMTSEEYYLARSEDAGFAAAGDRLMRAE